MEASEIRGDGAPYCVGIAEVGVTVFKRKTRAEAGALIEIGDDSGSDGRFANARTTDKQKDVGCGEVVQPGVDLCKRSLPSSLHAPVRMSLTLNGPQRGKDVCLCRIVANVSVDVT